MNDMQEGVEFFYFEYPDGKGQTYYAALVADLDALFNIHSNPAIADLPEEAKMPELISCGARFSDYIDENGQRRCGEEWVNPVNNLIVGARTHDREGNVKELRPDELIALNKDRDFKLEFPNVLSTYHAPDIKVRPDQIREEKTLRLQYESNEHKHDVIMVLKADRDTLLKMYFDPAKAEWDGLTLRKYLEDTGAKVTNGYDQNGKIIAAERAFYLDGTPAATAYCAEGKKNNVKIGDDVIPAVTTLYPNGNKKLVCFCEDGKRHNPEKDHPAVRRFDERGRLQEEMYMVHDALTDPADGGYCLMAYEPETGRLTAAKTSTGSDEIADVSPQEIFKYNISHGLISRVPTHMEKYKRRLTPVG